MPDHELIQRGAAADEDGRGSAAAAAGAAGPLPRRGNRAGIARHHTDVERADVDAELQRVRGHHRADAPFPQAFLDLAPALRQVPAAIAADLLARSRRPVEVVLEIGRQNLRRQTALREDDDLQLPLEELRRDATRFGQIRAPDAQLLVDHRRIDEQEELLAARRAALGHQLERLLDERFSELARIGDRGRRADEDRIGAVVLADATQPPQHVRQMAAEHAAIGVQLVDDHEAQVLEQLRPARMVRQDARMDHVGVAQHHVRAAADGAPRVLRRVAVVGEHTDLGCSVLRES